MNLEIGAYKLRPSLEADRDAIAGIWHSSASLPTVGPAAMPSLAQLRERVDVEFHRGWVVTVATHGSDIAGFLAIKPRESVLDQIFVRPESIGAGIGQALLAHAKAAMSRGFSLHTRSANMRARRFYEKAGLIYLREDTHPRDGDPIVHYGWNLH
jgi:putative acetyltransferase